ncbi:hypothetical protein HME9302_00111 [Alteripontixanthobacter maritimus]|uniref:HTH luxR-type domain-containing protein n=1 Tax=Alteripontixanthobacter maritimus TaxID=2161824 RepID=A0A369Q5Z7_9SPHN|nr:alpha/beta fold hydrolase [Alteripontixanthobacter maritimus]RDC58935.1 hypothetical protein HME9302_00111 [Alteripontixanthobacter maritimus]
MTDDGRTRDRLVAALYTAAIHPHRLSDYLRAWDDFILKRHVKHGGRNLREVVLAQALADDVFPAHELFELKRQQKRAENASGSWVGAETTLGIAVDESICECDPRTATKFGIMAGEPLSCLSLEATATGRLREAIRDVTGAKQSAFSPFIVIIYDGDGHPVPFFCERANHQSVQRSGRMSDPLAPALILRSCVTEWNEFGSDLLVEAFGLTQAEVEILKSLCGGMNTADIAEERGRSPETVRRQIKAIMAKSDIHSQSDLMRLVTGILNLCGHRTRQLPAGASAAFAPNDGYLFDQSDVGGGRQVEYIRYGDLKGVPVLLFQPNSLPIMPHSFVAAAKRSGLQIVAPFKPGALGSSQQEVFDPYAHASDASKIMEQLEFSEYWVVGHNMGGIYALMAAAQAPARVGGIAMIDTGAPIRDERSIRQMPPTAYRTFSAARDAPEMLYPPYAIAADLFFSDAQGRAEIMQLAHAESATDLSLLEDPAIRQCVEHNLEYTLSDATRAVDDLVLWMQDWTPWLQKIGPDCPALMLHGEAHDWLPFGDVARFAKMHPNIQVARIEGAGQLGLYAQPEFVLDRLAAAMTHRSCSD